jgi:hypothetical protein
MGLRRFLFDRLFRVERRQVIGVRWRVLGPASAALPLRAGGVASKPRTPGSGPGRRFAPLRRRCTEFLVAVLSSRFRIHTFERSTGRAVLSPVRRDRNGLTRRACAFSGCEDAFAANFRKRRRSKQFQRLAPLDRARDSRVEQRERKSHLKINLTGRVPWAHRDPETGPWLYRATESIGS